MIDLHTHSRFSDGSDSPEEIVRLAKEAGCTCVALTDHDRLDGIARARSAARRLEIDFIPGTEISCTFDNGTLHLLAYFLELEQGPMQDELLNMQAARTKRNEDMALRMAKAGIPITLDELLEEAGGPNLGRPHFAAVMMRKGMVTSIQEAFDLYLAKGRPYYVPKVQISARDAIGLVRASGSLPVLAHPLTLGLEPPALKSYVEELCDYGLVGMESYYGRYSPAERRGLADMAQALSLVATGGSDYHGTYKSGLDVGIGEGDLDVPGSIVEQLKGRLD